MQRFISISNFILKYFLFRYKKLYDINSYPCKIFQNVFAKTCNTACCDVCQKWVHILFSNISKYFCRKFQKQMKEHGIVTSA